MATAKTTTPVRALVDLPKFGAKCGHLANVPADQVDPLKAEGAIDDHKDAVAYARKVTPAPTEDAVLDV